MHMPQVLRGPQHYLELQAVLAYATGAQGSTARNTTVLPRAIGLALPAPTRYVAQT